MVNIPTCFTLSKENPWNGWISLPDTCDERRNTNATHAYRWVSINIKKKKMYDEFGGRFHGMQSTSVT